MSDCNQVVTGAFPRGPTTPPSCNVRQKSWTKSYSSRLLVYRTSSWKSFSNFSHVAVFGFFFSTCSVIPLWRCCCCCFFLLVTVNVKLEEAKKSSCEPKTLKMCHPSSIFFFKHKIWTFLCTKSLKHSKKSALEVLVKWPLDCLQRRNSLEKEVGGGGLLRKLEMEFRPRLGRNRV